MVPRFSVSKFLLTLTALALLSLPAAAQPETSKLRISAVPIAGFTPIYAADKLGFFKQEGLEVTIDRAAGGAQTVPLLVQGTLQFAVTPVVSAALANQQGFNLRIIPPSLDEKRSVPGQTAQIVLADSAIKSPADLKGKRVAVNTINSVNWLYDRAFVRSKGSSLRAKFNTRKCRFHRWSMPCCVARSTRSTFRSRSTILRSPPARFASSAIRLSRPSPDCKLRLMRRTAAWLDANPKTVKAFVSAMRKAVEHMRNNPPEAKKLIAEFTGAKPELVAVIPIDDWSTTLAVEDVQKTLQIMKQEGVLKKDLIANEMIHNVAPVTRRSRRSSRCGATSRCGAGFVRARRRQDLPERPDGTDRRVVRGCEWRIYQPAWARRAAENPPF